MKKLLLGCAFAVAAAAPAFAQTAPTAPAASSPVKVAVSEALFDSEGKRIGNVYRVTSNGSAQLIVNGSKLVTVPLATLSKVDGKLTTNMTRQEITSRR